MLGPMARFLREGDASAPLDEIRFDARRCRSGAGLNSRMPPSAVARC
jgi:hypothetical protein